MFLINLALAIGPAALLLVWAYRRDAAQPEPRRLVVRAFGLGLAAVVAAVLVGMIAEPFARLFSAQGRLVYQAYIVAGLLEEGAKLIVVLIFIARHTEFDEVADGMVYTMAASLGFAVVENAMYLADPSAVLLIRGFTAVPLHGTAGGLMGFFVGLRVIEKRGSILTGLTAAVALHGTYDYLLFRGGAASYLTIPILVAALFAVSLLFRTAVARDEAAGRVPPRGKG